MFLGATSEFATFICLAASFAIAIAIANDASSKNGANICLGIVWLLVLQNLMIGLGAHLASNSSETLKIVTQIPSMTLLITSIEVAIKNKTLFKDKTGKFFAVLLICSMISVLFGRGQILSILINIRNLITFYFTYRLARNILTTNDQIGKFYNGLMICARIILIAGIFLLLGGYRFYSFIGIDEVYIAKGSPLITESLDDRFYTTLVSTQIPRMGSLYYEPVNLAYVYASTLIISLFPLDNRKKSIADVIVNAAGLALTVGKGAILVVILCIGFRLLLILQNFISKSNNFKRTLIVIGTIIIVGGISFSIYYYTHIGAASSPHFIAVAQTWKNVAAAPLGHGLGTGGNMSTLFNGGGSRTSQWLSTGGESAMMAFMYQIGIPGAIALFFALFYMLPKENATSKDLTVYWFLPICLFAISILQDNTFTPQCIVLPMLLVGAASNRSSMKQQESPA